MLFEDIPTELLRVIMDKLEPAIAYQTIISLKLDESFIDDIINRDNKYAFIKGLQGKINQHLQIEPDTIMINNIITLLLQSIYINNIDWFIWLIKNLEYYNNYYLDYIKTIEIKYSNSLKNDEDYYNHDDLIYYIEKFIEYKEIRENEKYIKDYFLTYYTREKWHSLFNEIIKSRNTEMIDIIINSNIYYIKFSEYNPFSKIIIINELLFAIIRTNTLSVLKWLSKEYYKYINLSEILSFSYSKLINKWVIKELHKDTPSKSDMVEIKCFLMDNPNYINWYHKKYNITL